MTIARQELRCASTFDTPAPVAQGCLDRAGIEETRLRLLAGLGTESHWDLDLLAIAQDVQGH